MIQISITMQSATSASVEGRQWAFAWAGEKWWALVSISVDRIIAEKLGISASKMGTKFGIEAPTEPGEEA